jgi:hypothetical protein
MRTGIDDIEPTVDFPPERLVVQVATQEDSLDHLAHLGEGSVTQQPDLACAQPMTVGDQEQRAVAWTGPHNGEQPGELLKGFCQSSRRQV